MERIPVDPNLTLVEKWVMPTRLSPTYYWPATRNAIAAVPGILSVLFLAFVMKRRPGIREQYQYTVIFLTFGGYITMFPVASFNWVVSALLSFYDGGIRKGVNQSDWEESYALSFQTSVWGCSLAKQISSTSINSSFCVGFVISLMRYLLLLHGIEMTWFRVLLCSAIVMSPNVLMLIYIMFFGVITENDCCERILEVPEYHTPIYYYTYLFLIIISAVLFNIRTLLHLMKIMREHMQGGWLSSDKSQRDQLHLSLGFLLQSVAPLCSFGPFIVFITLYLQGILGPDWFSTYTNIACFLSTLINPAASMAFIPLFRREFMAILRCHSVEEADRYRRKSALVSKTTSIKPPK